MPVQRTHSNSDQHLLVNKSQYGLKMNFLKTFSILWSGAGGIRAQRNTIIRHQSRWSDSRKLFGFSHTRKKYLFVDLCSFVGKLHSIPAKFSVLVENKQTLAQGRVVRLQKWQKLLVGWLKVIICDDNVKVAFARTKPDSDQNELIVCNDDNNRYRMMLTQDLPLPGSIFSVKNPPSRCRGLHCIASEWETIALHWIRIRDNNLQLLICIKWHYAIDTIA